MKNTIVGLVALIGATGIACAVPYFHTDFDEASLGDITGLNIDTPNTDLLTVDSGTVTLDTVSQRLDLASNAANLWTNREGGPIAWITAPTVAVGETWFVQTQITHTDSPGGQSAGYDQTGITFYSGTAGSNPGSENVGAHQSLMVGLSDWNQWHHRVQGFADNNPNVSTLATVGDDTFEYRVEITENGASDIYNFFYREDPGDDWTQHGPVDLEQDFDNTAVGLFMKSHNNNATASTEFEYFTVDVISDVSGEDTDADGLDDGWETGTAGNLTDLTGLKAGPGPGADSGDFDGDGLTDLQEFDLAVTNAIFPSIDPTLADTDADGRDDGDEVNGVVGPPAIPATDPTNPDSDGDGLMDGVEDNSGTFVDETETGTDPTAADSDLDELEDGFEVTNSGVGYDPNVDDSASDFDMDASTVAEEIAAGTDVLLPTPTAMASTMERKPTLAPSSPTTMAPIPETPERIHSWMTPTATACSTEWNPEPARSSTRAIPARTRTYPIAMATPSRTASRSVLAAIPTIRPSGQKSRSVTWPPGETGSVPTRPSTSMGTVRSARMAISSSGISPEPS